MVANGVGATGDSVFAGVVATALEVLRIDEEVVGMVGIGVEEFEDADDGDGAAAIDPREVDDGKMTVHHVSIAPRYQNESRWLEHTDSLSGDGGVDCRAAASFLDRGSSSSPSHQEPNVQIPLLQVHIHVPILQMEGLMGMATSSMPSTTDSRHCSSSGNSK